MKRLLAIGLLLVACACSDAQQNLFYTAGHVLTTPAAGPVIVDAAGNIIVDAAGNQLGG